MPIDDKSRLTQYPSGSRKPEQNPYERSGAQPPWKLKLLYDGACPFCKREISWMSQHNKKGNLAFEDITSPNFDPARYGLTQEVAEGVIHAVFHDGRVIRKVEVFIEAYRLLDLGWLVAPLSWPWIRPVANSGYEIFARYRVPLGKLFGRLGCDSSHCKIGSQ